MKKTARMIVAIVLVFAIVLLSSPHHAQAKKIDTPPNIAAGSWTAGTSVDIASMAKSAPTWLQLLSNEGVKMTSAGSICHPLRGGQFGWFGLIMQYKDGKWVKLTTTNDWVPNKEGEFMACAQAPAAGTYALFGYWQKPAGYEEPINSINCDSLTWDISVLVTQFTGSVSGVPAGTQIVLSIYSTNIEEITIAGDTTTTTDDSAGNFHIYTSFSDKPDLISLLFTLPEYGCTYKLDLDY